MNEKYLENKSVWVKHHRIYMAYYAVARPQDICNRNRHPGSTPAPLQGHQYQRP